ncbi:hypothetical protein [Nocardioides sp. MH1]|uniref:hypothetical protein n=1 Tax=Nocardioides sp. MH1 TaxID=3242490 RepID=UPI0035213614
MTWRTTAPTPWAMPSQIATKARASAEKPFDTGPGPLRTARGAGRRDALLFFAVLLLVVGFFAVLRDRELVLVRLPLLRLVDVLRLRDRVGEDVRVAMLLTLLKRHIRHMDHASVSQPQTPLCSQQSRQGETNVGPR